MDVTFSVFVRALRKADIRVSPAETLDAFSVLKQIGIADRSFLKDALSLVLAKTLNEKKLFADAFERFFNQLGFREPPKQSMVDSKKEQSLPDSLPTEIGEPLANAVKELIRGNREPLTDALQRIANDLNIQDIRTLREKQGFALAIGERMGLPRLNQYLLEDPDAQSNDLLRYIYQYMRRQVKDFVDRQYALHVDPTSKRSVLEAALKNSLNYLPPEYYEEVHRVVEKLAERLKQSYRKRNRRSQRGMLEFRRTMRDNMGNDGNIVTLRWRKVKREKSTVYVICDVSNSMAAIARFLLLFLYELVDVLPQVRAFAFSGQLGEVTSVLQSRSTEAAIEETLFDWGKGNTDYGRAIRDFRALCGKDLDRRSTIVVLGDGRSNFYEAELPHFAELSRRVKRVFWLNPEARSQWREGDSEMYRYAPYCNDILLCNQLQHIERFADRLLTSLK